MSPLGEFNLSFLKNTRGANDFKIETEKTYDYFLIIGTFKPLLHVETFSWN